MKNWPVLAISSGVALFLFAAFWSGFAFINRHKRGGFFLDPQDSYSEGQPGREFPLSAQQGTFEPLLKHYIGVAQLVFTVAAGSIALGGTNNQPVPVRVAGAKLVLAWCILYGVPLCGLLLWRYDEYGQNKASFTLFWYSLVFALGFSCLLCFVLGYLAWGVALARVGILNLHSPPEISRCVEARIFASKCCFSQAIFPTVVLSNASISLAGSPAARENQK